MGEKNINYTFLDVTVNDFLPFKWTLNDNIITIDGEKSNFAKSWIIIENKSKYQKWRSTDGSNTVQIMELKKE